MDAISINWNCPKPLAEQLCAIIKQRYIHGAGDGDRVPTECQLAAEYGVNRTIARRAVELLRKEGLVMRRPRHGTFVLNGIRNGLTLAFYEETKKYSFAALIDRFEDLHPAVRVRRVLLPVSGYCEMTSRMLAEGQLDVLRISAGLFLNYDPPSRFLSLNGLSRRLAAINHPEAWNAFRFLKTRYGLPLAFGPVVVAYNRDMFRQAGLDFPRDDWSLCEFADTATRLTNHVNNGIQSDRYGFLCPNMINRWMMFVYSHGGRLWNVNTGKFALSEPAAMDGLNFLRELIGRKICAPFHGVSDAYCLFIRGKAAMTLISCHTVARLRSEIKFDWGVAAFPTCRVPADFMVVDGLAVAKQSTQLDAVNAFLGFCMSDEAQQMISNAGGPLPVADGMRMLDTASIVARIHQRFIAHGAGKPDKVFFPELPFGSPLGRAAENETMLFVNGMQTAEEYASNLMAYTRAVGA